MVNGCVVLDTKPSPALACTTGCAHTHALLARAVDAGIHRCVPPMPCVLEWPRAAALVAGLHACVSNHSSLPPFPVAGRDRRRPPRPRDRPQDAADLLCPARPARPARGRPEPLRPRVPPADVLLAQPLVFLRGAQRVRMRLREPLWRAQTARTLSQPRPSHGSPPTHAHRRAAAPTRWLPSRRRRQHHHQHPPSHPRQPRPRRRPAPPGRRRPRRSRRSRRPCRRRRPWCTRRCPSPRTHGRAR